MSAKQEKKKSFFFWLLFGVIVPLMIVAIIALVILIMAGVDVGGYVKGKLSSVPVVSTFVIDKEEKDTQQKMKKATETITIQEEDISDLENEIARLEGLVDDLKIDIKKQKKREKSMEESEDTTEDTDLDEVKKVAASFRKMDPQKAAQILMQMNKTNAIEILDTLSGDVKGDILAELEPKEAADIMEIMMNES